MPAARDATELTCAPAEPAGIASGQRLRLSRRGVARIVPTFLGTAPERGRSAAPELHREQDRVASRIQSEGPAGRVVCVERVAGCDGEFDIPIANEDIRVPGQEQDVVGARGQERWLRER